MDTVAPIVYALNGSIDEMLNPGKSKDELKEISVVQLREMYEAQVATIKEIDEKHIGNIRAHYEEHRTDFKETTEQLLASKDEIIKSKDEIIKAKSDVNKTLKILCIVLGAVLAVCLTILIGLLILEVMNPDLGWLRF